MCVCVCVCVCTSQGAEQSTASYMYSMCSFSLYYIITSSRCLHCSCVSSTPLLPLPHHNKLSPHHIYEGGCPAIPSMKQEVAPTAIVYIPILSLSKAGGSPHSTTIMGCAVPYPYPSLYPSLTCSFLSLSLSLPLFSPASPALP